VTKEPAPHAAGELRKQKTRHSSNPPVEMPIGWIIDVRAELDDSVAAAAASATAAPVPSAAKSANVAIAATPANMGSVTSLASSLGSR
jgi:hypothetical protein